MTKEFESTKRFIWFNEGIKYYETDYIDFGYLKTINNSNISVYDTKEKKYAWGKTK